MAANGEKGAAAWEPHPDALHKDVVDGGDTRSTSILLRHATTPFRRTVPADDPRAIEAAATDYVHAADKLANLKLPSRWLSDLKGGGNPLFEFGWLPFNARGASGDPRTVTSFRVISRSRKREPDETEREPDETLILLGTDRFPLAQSKTTLLASEFGLRVVIHLRRENRTVALRITGLSASLPFGPYDVRKAGSIGPSNLQRLDAALNDAALTDFEIEVGRELHLDPLSLDFRGFRIGEDDNNVLLVEIRGRGLSRPSPGRVDPYEFLVLTRHMGRDGLEILSTSKVPLVACMAGTARVFWRDPASQGPPRTWRHRRPTRREEQLDSYRHELPTPSPLHKWPCLEIVQTAYVLGDDQASGDLKSVHLPGGGPAVRRNDMCAVSAHHNLLNLFRKLDLYGIPLETYFEFAALPIKGYYRSGIQPGPGKDGQTVNGQIRPEGWPVGTAFFRADAEKPLLEAHLALGDLSTRHRKPWNPVKRKPAPAEPLGFSTDPRWIWHEIGHVLTMAALGELELRIAHSPGDALAAIVADPASGLVERRGWRGLTFPWVFVPRRHDRCVMHGWSWTGTLGRPLRDVSDEDRLRRKGYWSEQILSSSLFRLYRSLGGDTVDPLTGRPDRVARKRVSDHTVYLIMQGLKALGDQRVVPANRPELFVAALADADEGTETCATVDDDDAAVPNVTHRIGGCARKVIRWAFEAQGLYPPDPDALSNAPGRAEPVDIFIRDRRPGRERTEKSVVFYGPGAYDPVSLDWGRLRTVNHAPAPAWFADERSIRFRNGSIVVAVSNRGWRKAKDVTVDLWLRPWPLNQDPPLWNTLGWNHVGQVGPLNVRPGRRRRFGPFAIAAAAGRYLVVAQATCVADRANTDNADLACSVLKTPLDEVVPSDNNLGLAVIHVA